MKSLIKENWVWAWISLYQIRLIRGKTSPQEDEIIIKYLNEIMKNSNKHELMGQDNNDILPNPPEEILNDITELTNKDENQLRKEEKRAGI